MKIELIAVDLDGTALRTDKSISDRTRETLGEAAARGVRVVPATGRFVKMVPRPVREIPGVRYVLTSNGAAVRDLSDNSVLYSNLMPRETSERIIRFFLSRGYLTEIYTGGVSYANRDAFERLYDLKLPEEFYSYILNSQIFVDDLEGLVRERGLRAEKINVPYVPEERKEEVRREVLAMKEYAVTYSGGLNLEINYVSANKGDGLKHLCERLGVSPDRVMAIGDQDNDLSMFRLAGFSVAMGNATPPVLGAADAVTGTNDEDGVALAVERYVLQ